MKSKIPFYEMEPKEFENLCFDVLTYMNEFKTILRDYRIGTTKYDFTGTYIDTKGLEKKFVVVCKHVDSLSERNLMQILNANTSFDKIIVIISGKFSTSNKTIQTTVGKEILLIDGEKISNIILGNQRLIDLYFNPFVKKRKVRKILTFFATLLFAASVYILYINYLSLFGDKQNEKSYTNLDEKISSVENALISIDNLESYLSELRSDMMNTKENKEKIEKEYVEAMKLKSLTDEQMELISSSINKTSKKATIINYIVSFIAGIVASIIAAYTYDWLRKRRKRKFT